MAYTKFESQTAVQIGYLELNKTCPKRVTSTSNSLSLRGKRGWLYVTNMSGDSVFLWYTSEIFETDVYSAHSRPIIKDIGSRTAPQFNPRCSWTDSLLRHCRWRPHHWRSSLRPLSMWATTGRGYSTPLPRTGRSMTTSSWGPGPPGRWSPGASRRPGIEFFWSRPGDHRTSFRWASLRCWSHKYRVSHQLTDFGLVDSDLGMFYHPSPFLSNFCQAKQNQRTARIEIN